MIFLTKINGGRKGFTLIELLVVIAIIGILASVVLASLNTARAKSRDATRLSQTREVEKALQMYFADSGTYPNTGGAWRGTSPGCYGAGGNNAIPGLAPTYISVVPQDPQQPVGGGCYLYRSDGVDFKFLIHGTFETCNPGSCPLQDPQRMSQRTGAVYSAGARTW
jgi:type II secretion system protein G